MDLTAILRELFRLRWFVLAILLLSIGITAFMASRGEEQLVGAASARLLVDSKRSAVTDITGNFEATADRAVIYSSLVTSEPVKRAIGERMGLPPEAIVSATANQNADQAEPEKRANEILGEGGGYRLSVTSQEGLPVLEVFTQAPTGPRAIALANATGGGLASYIQSFQEKQGIPDSRRITVTQLGEAQGGALGAGTKLPNLGLTFMACLIGGILLLLLGSSTRRALRKAQVQQFGVRLDLAEYEPEADRPREMAS